MKQQVEQKQDKTDLVKLWSVCSDGVTLQSKIIKGYRPTAPLTSLQLLQTLKFHVAAHQAIVKDVGELLVRLNFKPVFLLMKSMLEGTLVAFKQMILLQQAQCRETAKAKNQARLEQGSRPKNNVSLDDQAQAQAYGIQLQKLLKGRERVEAMKASSAVQKVKEVLKTVASTTSTLHHLLQFQQYQREERPQSVNNYSVIESQLLANQENTVIQLLQRLKSKYLHFKFTCDTEQQTVKEQKDHKDQKAAILAKLEKCQKEKYRLTDQMAALKQEQTRTVQALQKKLRQQAKDFKEKLKSGCNLGKATSKQEEKSEQEHQFSSQNKDSRQKPNSEKQPNQSQSVCNQLNSENHSYCISKTILPRQSCGNELLGKAKSEASEPVWEASQQIQNGEVRKRRIRFNTNILNDARNSKQFKYRTTPLIGFQTFDYLKQKLKETEQELGEKVEVIKMLQGQVAQLQKAIRHKRTIATDKRKSIVFVQQKKEECAQTDLVMLGQSAQNQLYKNWAQQRFSRNMPAKGAKKLINQHFSMNQKGLENRANAESQNRARIKTSFNASEFPAHVKWDKKQQIKKRQASTGPQPRLKMDKGAFALKRRQRLLFGQEQKNEAGKQESLRVTRGNSVPIKDLLQLSQLPAEQEYEQIGSKQLRRMDKAERMVFGTIRLRM